MMGKALCRKPIMADKMSDKLEYFLSEIRPRGKTASSLRRMIPMLNNTAQPMMI